MSIALIQILPLLFIPRRTVLDFACSPSRLLQKGAQVISAPLALIVIFSSEILCVQETQEKYLFLALSFVILRC